MWTSEMGPSLCLYQCNSLTWVTRLSHKPVC
ncbi:hypothetical protein F383_21799 [Gossypium arboreum]|uniref:Uncharacterized protein n=1 Tax=Gossypium arboreum TaxID=29729 RepID=A0A0B0MQT7_GOSAR|nr:hypothetical protein F383_21799 [Gossypium arboreum]